MDVETSIHWHGLLVPPGMDGVPLISFPPIAPGATFTYEFPIRQSGTYWYHSHTSLQEQSGVYGALVIEPANGAAGADREHVVLLSDWTREDPQEVNRTLKRGSEWYALVKGSAQSVFGAARGGRLGDFFTRELQRMPPMDIADVAYDHFLANGRPEIALAAAPGETVRLRIVDGSATTFFYLEYAGGPLTIVAADGQDVEPVEEGRLLIGVAETYDVLVRVPAAGAWELRATAQDGSGYASVWIGTGERHPAPAVPHPDVYQTMMGASSLKRIFALTPGGAMGMPDDQVAAGRFDQPGMMDMGGMAGMARHARHGPRHGPWRGRRGGPDPGLAAGDRGVLRGRGRSRGCPRRVDADARPCRDDGARQPRACSRGSRRGPGARRQKVRNRFQPDGCRRLLRRGPGHGRHDGAPLGSLREIARPPAHRLRPRAAGARRPADPGRGHGAVRLVSQRRGALGERRHPRPRGRNRALHPRQPDHDAPPDAPARPLLPRRERPGRSLAAQAHGGRRPDVHDGHRVRRRRARRLVLPLPPALPHEERHGPRRALRASSN